VRIILPPGRDRDQVEEAVAITGAHVGVAGAREDPASVPPEARPDLLVIGTAAGEGDPSAIASAWTARREFRPRAVVLIETLRAVDRLRAVAAGVDAVFPAERMVEELPRYVRPWPGPGHRPRACWWDPDGERAAAITSQLEQANVHVVRVAAQPLQELLDREVPDLLMLAAARRCRCLHRRPHGAPGPRFHLLPILFLDWTPHPTGSRRSGRRRRLPRLAGRPGPAPQTVITRAEGGAGSARCCTGQLTGLLNHGTLTAG
jgi:hypothetical protein